MLICSFLIIFERCRTEVKSNDTNQTDRRRKRNETMLWLIIIACFLIIVLQATGIISWFVLQGKWTVASIAVVGLALTVSSLNQYFVNSRLRASLKKLMEQQKFIKPITLSKNDESENQTDEDLQWKEQVRFNAVIEERQRLARELHDAVSQQLFAISMTATAVSRTMERDWERAKHQVQLIEEMASVAQSEMRALLLHLRPIHLDGRSLGLAIEKLVSELVQKIPMQISLQLDNTLLMKQEVEDHLFRITQEALSNALRHAKAEMLSITLFKDKHDVHLYIVDNGIGFNIESRKQGSYGLLTMEERVREMNGVFEIKSSPGEGTSIKIIIPYQPV